MKRISVRKTACFIAVLFLLVVWLPACSPEDVIILLQPGDKKETSEFQAYEKNYSLKEVQLLEQADFRALNAVSYVAKNPYDTTERVSDEYVACVSNFAGTVIKSVTYAAVGGATSAGPGKKIDTYDVKLNQPFIYVVYDKNSLSLYVGHVDMP